MRELKLLVPSGTEYLEIENRLYEIVAKKRKVMGYYGKYGPRPPEPLEKNTQCAVF